MPAEPGIAVHLHHQRSGLNGTPFTNVAVEARTAAHDPVLGRELPRLPGHFASGWQPAQIRPIGGTRLISSGTSVIQGPSWQRRFDDVTLANHLLMSERRGGARRLGLTGGRADPQGLKASTPAVVPTTMMPSPAPGVTKWSTAANCSVTSTFPVPGLIP